MTMSVAMFGTALPMKKCSVLMHFDSVYILSQNPLMGLQEKMEMRMTAIHQAMTTPCTMLAASLNLGTEKIRR